MLLGRMEVEAERDGVTARYRARPSNSQNFFAMHEITEPGLCEKKTAWRKRNVRNVCERKTAILRNSKSISLPNAGRNFRISRAPAAIDCTYAHFQNGEGTNPVLSQDRTRGSTTGVKHLESPKNKMRSLGSKATIPPYSLKVRFFCVKSIVNHAFIALTINSDIKRR